MSIFNFFKQLIRSTHTPKKKPGLGPDQTLGNQESHQDQPQRSDQKQAVRSAWGRQRIKELEAHLQNVPLKKIAPYSSQMTGRVLGRVSAEDSIEGLIQGAQQSGRWEELIILAAHERNLGLLAKALKKSNMPGQPLAGIRDERSLTPLGKMVFRGIRIIWLIVTTYD